MLEWLSEILSSKRFMPHGHCWLWTPGLLWLEASTNFLIGFAYLCISGTLGYLVYRIRDIPFKAMYLAFGIFIVTCGFTHFFDVLVIWKPYYWMDGIVRAVTAIASVGTALMLPPLIPKAIAVARGAKAAHDKGIQLETAVKDLARLYEKTKEVEQAKTNFFANVSHELRTPLALILGPGERLLKRDDLPNEVRFELEVITRNARTLLKQVNDILDASKLESGKLTLRYYSIDLAKVVRLTAANFDGIAADRQIRFIVDAPDTLPAEADVEKVQRVLLNLLSNAFKFTPKGGTIRVVLQLAADNKVTLRVSDSGPGVRPEMRGIIFERFRQGDAGVTRQFGGTGLGLAIAKDFVELHGGRISVADAEEGGALFEIELPVKAPAGTKIETRADATSNEQAQAARAALDDLGQKVAAAAASEQLGKPTVLIVEDNSEMNQFIARTLGGEYRIETALDGEEGLEKAIEVKPDLIISDVMMPKMSGDALVAAVRAREDLDAVPILMLTAKADDELRIKLLKEGAQDYVMKPFPTEELLARARNLIVMKRARDVLQSEIEHHVRDLEELAKEVTTRKRELQVAADGMRIARDHALEAAKARSNFMSVVSHELRTPLTTLRLHLQRLQREQDEVLGDRQKKMLDKMDSSSKRLLSLIDSLLEYARVESGHFVVAADKLDPAALVREVVDELAPQAEAKGLSLEVHESQPPKIVVTDARALRLVVMNLVDNAVKYTEEGRVDVELTGGERDFTIVVKDTGPGISDTDRARIFEPFEQLQSVTHKHTTGIGLGLALVREVVEAFGGLLTVESRQGAGSTFIARLPLDMSQQQVRA